MSDDVVQPDPLGTAAGRLARERPGPVPTVLLATAGAIGLGLLLQPHLPKESITLVFLVGVLLAAAAHGIRAGVAAAILASAAMNFFFIPPVFTFFIADREEVFALAIFLIAGVLTGSIAGRMRQEADAASRRAAVIESLNDFAEQLAAATRAPEVLAAAGLQLSRTLREPVVLLEPGLDQHSADHLTQTGSWPAGAALSPGDWHAAAFARRTGRVAHRPADPDREQHFEFHPLSGARGVAALYGIRRSPSPGPGDLTGVSAILRHATVARARLDHAEDAAAARAAALEERLRNAVLTSLSHDLRTPLATIVGAVTSLRELGPAMPEEARADLLAAIEDEAGRLTRYVANLLDMTRVEAGALTISRDWIDVGDVVGTALARARAVHPDAMFQASLPPDLPPVHSDAMLLGQILFNLLDNAAKYAGAEEPVTVAVAVAQEALRIATTDRGPGIPAAEQGRIFEKFRRGGASDQRAPGTGLGLAIARGMALALGGTLTLESPVAAGRGSRFVLSIPLLSPQAPSP